MIDNLSKTASKIWGEIRTKKARDIYESNPKYCLQCNTIISWEKRFSKFCDSSCSAIYNNEHKTKKHHCIVCKKVLKKGKYCSSKCQSIAQDRELVNKWLSGYISGNNNSKTNIEIITAVRRWCLERANNRCELCGWAEINQNTGKVPLQIHHIDGNSTNSSSTNLQVLCPNCHSLTSTYGGSNRGNGRRERYKQV